jgi:hypothetical protein
LITNGRKAFSFMRKRVRVVAARTAESGRYRSRRYEVEGVGALQAPSTWLYSLLARFVAPGSWYRLIEALWRVSSDLVWSSRHRGDDWQIDSMVVFWYVRYKFAMHHHSRYCISLVF